MASTPVPVAAQRFEWRTVLRHRAPLRAMHWINLLCMLALVGSGLQIFNAHPALYWGAASHFADPLFATEAVRGADGNALYFSRAPIPWPRDAFMHARDTMPAGGPWLRHIGLYAYRAGFLRTFAALPPGRLERIESLEQLRVLEAGHRIAVALAPEPFPPGVDTPEDLARAEARWASQR